MVNVLPLLGLFFQSSLGKQVVSDVRTKLKKSKKPWYLKRTFVGPIITVVSIGASKLLGGAVTEGQIAEIVDYVMTGLDMLSVYGASLSLFGIVNRDQK